MPRGRLSDPKAGHLIVIGQTISHYPADCIFLHRLEHCDSEAENVRWPGRYVGKVRCEDVPKYTNDPDPRWVALLSARFRQTLSPLKWILDFPGCPTTE